MNKTFFCHIFGEKSYRDDFKMFDVYKNRNGVSESDFL